jgi:hypothetical protein
MGTRKASNTKRLTKKQVQELIASEGELHQEFTAFFERTYNSGDKDQPQIYELSGDRFLFVHDPRGNILPGKGDIYPREHFIRLIHSTQQTRDDYARNIRSSVSHWLYYSKSKNCFIDMISELSANLASGLSISSNQLDFSYKSLDAVSSGADDYGIDRIKTELYDNLVAYVGEVMRLRVKGRWEIRKDSPKYEYPIICARGGVLMPINVVWTELNSFESINLRQETANEIRRFSMKYR